MPIKIPEKDRLRAALGAAGFDLVGKREEREALGGVDLHGRADNVSAGVESGGICSATLAV
jgi:hypothetical protein